MNIELLKYPTGKFCTPGHFDAEQLEIFKTHISEFPQRLKSVLLHLPENKLDVPYRPEGWTARQVVHHLADSHINSYIRYRWTLTEKRPTIKAYNESDWSLLPDAMHGPINYSVDILSAVHAKWSYFMNQLDESDFKKTFIHPESGKELDLYYLTALYAWHGNHHIGHIKIIVNS
jgi:hypothetical protein